MTEEKRPLRVFLCHASADKPAVRELFQRLKGEGWIDPWLDAVKILPGQHWTSVISQSLETADSVIIFISNYSINREGFIQRELNYAWNLSLEKPRNVIFLIPLRLEECEVPYDLRERQWADYFGEKRDETYTALLQALKLRHDQKLRLEEEERVRQEKEKREREAAEKAERERIEREIAEKIAHETAEKAEREMLIQEKVKAEHEVSESESHERAKHKTDEKADPGIQEQENAKKIKGENITPSNEEIQKVQSSTLLVNRASISKLIFGILAFVLGIAALITLWWGSSIFNQKVISPQATKFAAQQYGENINPDAELIFGPFDGTISQDPADGFVASASSSVDIKNFIMEARVYNPYDIKENPWAFAVDFRETGTDYAIFLHINSDRTWVMTVDAGGNWKDIANGTLQNLDISATGSNLIRLIVLDDNVTFYLNNDLVDTLDISMNPNKGNVVLVASLEVTDQSTQYSDFMIWKLP